MNLDPFSLPLARPLATARGAITEREGFLVRIEHAGQVGLGEATPLSGWTESLDDCRAALESVTDPARAIEDDTLAATPAARHGVALALADARARAADEPLYRHLGGERRVERVPVNATVGDGDVPETVAAARGAVEAGFECLKVKVGARPLAADEERLRAVREACPDVELRADANGAWDRETARAAIDEFAPLDLAYLEQPLPAADLAGHAALREGGGTIALDESLAAASVDEVLAADAADVLVCKPMALGGPDRARATARRAREAGCEAVFTTTIDAALARAGAVHVAASLPDVPACGLATAGWLARDLAPDPCPVAGGAMAVPQGKGNIPYPSTGGEDA
jgi:o-succinylbenzoate synthase